MHILTSSLGRRTFLASSALVGLSCAAASPAAQAELSVDEDVIIHESRSDQGFLHPGVSLTATTLRTLREKIAAGAEPWATYAAQTAKSGYAALDAAPRNRREDSPESPRITGIASQGDNSLFISDGLLAYTQAVMFVLTGLPAHRANALEVIALWAQCEPSDFAYFADAHIHTGVPMQRMVTAAELLRHTSAADGSSPFGDEMIEAFSTNLVRPVVETFQDDNNHFMNQHTYPLLGATAAAIFLDDRALYERSVEWFTVNSTAEDQGFNGSISRLFRWVDRDDSTGEALPEGRVQHVEMGRDQAHGGGDLNNAWELARMHHAQGTDVDPVTGTVSSGADAVSVYGFLDERLLDAADYFCRYMLGEDPEWTPVAYAISSDGTVRDTYRRIAPGYRGRYTTMNFWDLYYHYTYEAGIDVAERAPHYTRAFAQRFEERYHSGGGVSSAWENVDGGGDFWLHIPAGAAAEGASSLPRATPGPHEIHLADRCTVLAGTVSVERPSDAAPRFRIQGGRDTARVAVQSASTSAEQIALRVRTTGTAELVLDDGRVRCVLPDTRGQWRWIVLAGGTGDHLVLALAAPARTTVDIAQMVTDVASLPPGPVFDEELPAVVVGATRDRLAVRAPARTDGDTLPVHRLDGMPRDVRIDASTGEITWKKPVPGTWTALVAADTGEMVATAEIEVRIGKNREDAVRRASEPFDPEETYVSWTRSNLESARELALAGSRARSGDQEFAALLAAVVDAAAGLELLDPQLEDGSLDYSALLVAADVDLPATQLVDGDPTTGPWYGQAVDLTHTFDFGPDFTVAVEKIALEGNIFPDRVASTILLGSRDGEEWTRLTPGSAAMTQDLQELEVAEDLVAEPWRYLRLHLADPQPDVLYGIVRNLMEFTEFHIHGARTETGNTFTEVSLSAGAAVAGKIRRGDEVQVSVTSREPLDTVEVTIDGRTVAAAPRGDSTFVATASVLEAPSGFIDLEVTGTRSDGSEVPALRGTTDGSTLQVGGDVETQLRIGPDADAAITASHRGWGGSPDEATVAGYVVDGDPETFGDLDEGAGSYYRVDLAEGRAITLEETCLLPRESHPGRLDGARWQGSTDGETWTDVTDPVEGASAGVWSSPAAHEGAAGPWTSLRLLNEAPWNGNLSELEIYGTVTG
jgi:hypothetical protein